MVAYCCLVEGQLWHCKGCDLPFGRSQIYAHLYGCQPAQALLPPDLRAAYQKLPSQKRFADEDLQPGSREKSSNHSDPGPEKASEGLREDATESSGVARLHFV